jgi:hypothetical protein
MNADKFNCLYLRLSTSIGGYLSSVFYFRSFRLFRG